MESRLSLSWEEGDTLHKPFRICIILGSLSECRAIPNPENSVNPVPTYEVTSLSVIFQTRS